MKKMKKKITEVWAVLWCVWMLFTPVFCINMMIELSRLGLNPYSCLGVTFMIWFSVFIGASIIYTKPWKKRQVQHQVKTACN